MEMRWMNRFNDRERIGWLVACFKPKKNSSPVPGTPALAWKETGNGGKIKEIQTAKFRELGEKKLTVKFKDLINSITGHGQMEFVLNMQCITIHLKY